MLITGLHPVLFRFNPFGIVIVIKPGFHQTNRIFVGLILDGG